MKTISLFILSFAIVACGGSSGGSKKVEAVRLDPATQDKFEAHIQRLSPGMVTTESSVGTALDFDVDTNGNWTAVEKNENSETKETILNVSGDEMYTLVEEVSNGVTTRQVRLESKEKLIREYGMPLPPGTSLDVSGDRLTLVVPLSFEMDLDSGVRYITSARYQASINLNDIRCSLRASTVVNDIIIQNGTTRNFPQTGSTAVGGCGRTLTRTELQTIDLASIRLCDETTDGKEVACQENMNLSYLVQ